MFALFVFDVPGRLVTGDGDHWDVVAGEGLAEHLLTRTGRPDWVGLEVLEILHEVGVPVGVAVCQVAGGSKHDILQRNGGQG